MSPRVTFLDYLPEAFATGGQPAGGDAACAAGEFLAAFLAAFEELYDELARAIGGAGDGTGGIPDLYDPRLTPPGEFPHGAGAGDGGDDAGLGWLSFLASWIWVRLRPEKTTGWNREFLVRAIELQAARGTLTGLERLLRAWLAGELVESDPPPLVLSDLTGEVNGVAAAFQLGETSTLGVQTVLGEGLPHFFVVDLPVAPNVRELRNPVGLDVLQRAARALLDAEKPAHTYYELRLRAHTMQLAPPSPSDTWTDGEIYAQLPDDDPDSDAPGTTLLWAEPWVFAADTADGPA